MIIIRFKFDRIFLPETLRVNRRPLKTVRIKLFYIFVKGTQHPYITFKHRRNVLNGIDQILILDVSLEDSINNLQQFMVHHQLQTPMIPLNILENHKSKARDLLPRNLLQNLTNTPHYVQPGNRHKFLYCVLGKRQHPDIEQSVVNELNIVPASRERLREDTPATILNKNPSKVRMLVQMRKATHQSIVRKGRLLGPS
jgi:hypothetical protein